MSASICWEAISKEKHLDVSAPLCAFCHTGAGMVETIIIERPETVWHGLALMSELRS